MKLNDRIEIHWTDVVEDPRWMTPEEAGQVPPESQCRTIGYFLKESEDAIWISSMIGPRKASSRSSIFIPKGMITKMRILQVRRKK